MKKYLFFVICILSFCLCIGCSSKEEADKFTADAVDTINNYISDAAHDISQDVRNEFNEISDSVKNDITDSIKDIVSDAVSAADGISSAEADANTDEADINITEADGNSDEAAEINEPENQVQGSYKEYYFRSKKLLEQHYEKHGKEMGFKNSDAYRKAASDVINNPDALHKTEAEDGDFVYYVEATNEFVILSTDGYIRTYFYPDAGKKYYDRQ